MLQQQLSTKFGSATHQPNLAVSAGICLVRESHALVSIVPVDHAFILMRIDNTLEVVFSANRAAELEQALRQGEILHLAQQRVKKSAPVRSILLTKTIRGTSYLISLTPNCLRLRFNTRSTENNYCTIKYT